jgi:membrane-bound lytic murein transglycosylase MltF
MMRLQRPQVHRYAPGTLSRPSVGAGRPDDAIRAALQGRIHAISRILGVDPVLSESIARAESNLDQTARSPDGKSAGAFQMKRPTIAEMQRRMTGDPSGLPLSDEVTLGVGYLRYLDDVFAREAVLDARGRRTTPIADPAEREQFTIAAYNAGEGRVAAAQRQAKAAGANPRRFNDIRPFLPAITQRYVQRVNGYRAAAQADSN